MPDRATTSPAIVVTIAWETPEAIARGSPLPSIAITSKPQSVKNLRTSSSPIWPSG